MTIFSFERKTTTYRKDFVNYKQCQIQRALKPGDALTIIYKPFTDPYMKDRCDFQHQLALIEHEIEEVECSSDMWPLVRQKITNKRALMRRMKEKYKNCPNP